MIMDLLQSIPEQTQCGCTLQSGCSNCIQVFSITLSKGDRDLYRQPACPKEDGNDTMQ